MNFQIHKADRTHKANIDKLIKGAKIGQRAHPTANTFWVAKCGNEIVGCAGIELFGKNSAIFVDHAVREDFRKKGIGSALTASRIAFAKKKGVKILALATMYYRFNFYKKRGFRTCPRAELPASLKNYPMFTDPRYKKCAVMIQEI